MESDMKDALCVTVDRLAAAAGLLEQAVERLAQRQSEFVASADASISHIVATVEARREAELADKLAAAELKIAELQGREAGDSSGVGRKTWPTTTANLFAKHGVEAHSMNASELDAALVSLSLEQRITVKAQLMRAGLLG